MISSIQAQQIHNILIEKFGGSPGIRDLGGLSSALSRPFQTFEGNDLYPSPLHKAACLIESMLMNHPFVDGNKRTGYVLMRLFLIQNSLDLKAGEQEKYDFVISIASGIKRYEEILQWLQINTEPAKSA
jgi:death on curing protein